MVGNWEMGQSQWSEDEGLSSGRGCCSGTGSSDSDGPGLSCDRSVT